MRPRARAGLLSALMLVALAPARAERGATPPAPLTVEEAVEFALSHHPALAVKAAGEEAASSLVELARTGYLPRVDVAAQIDRATANVVPGSFFPMAGVPPTMGPPMGRSFDSGVFGSGVSVSASWDVLGLKVRMAQVDAALAETARAHAATEATRLAVGFAAADAFLTLLARAETVKAAKASVERARVFSAAVKPLVDTELRPGADLSRAEAERAVASTLLIRAQLAEEVARSELAQALGVAGEKLTVPSGALARLPSAEVAAAERKHPLLVEAGAAVALAGARKRAVDYQYLPRLDVATALWVRGSGKFPGGFDLGDAQGLLPDTPNWAAGLILTWPIFDLFIVRARSHVETANVHVATARESEIGQAIRTQLDSARAILAGARRIAKNTPIALDAARASERQATARYQAGLATAIDVADAQRVLAQAEIDDSVARLGVWSGLLLLSRAAGDLDPFLVEARAAAKGAR